MDGINKFLGVLGVLVLFLGGCSYAVKPVSMPAVNTYSSYDEKIPGTWVVVIDEDMKNISREIRTTSYVCSAHKFSINIGDAIATSVKRTMRIIFENTVDRTNIPTKEELKALGANGSILIKLDTFEPRVRCSRFLVCVVYGISWYRSADIEFGVIVRGENRKLLTTSVDGSAVVGGDGGVACEGAANVLAEAISKSVKKALERIGERLSNSPRLRQDSKYNKATSLRR